MNFTKLTIVLALLAAPELATAQSAISRVRESEAAVKEMPLIERPNRIGHFYGNTVRRRYYGTLVVNRMHTDRPLARYFYRAN